MLSEDWQRDQYERVGNDHNAWALCAGDLLAASGVLRKVRSTFDLESLAAGDTVPDEGRVHLADLMLRGFAVECLLKALWVKRGGTVCVGGRYVGIKGAADHNLVELSDVNQLSFTPDKRNVLKRLSIFMTAAGRYPVAARWSDTKIQSTPSGGKAQPTYWATPSDDDAYDSIVQFLDGELER